MALLDATLLNDRHDRRRNLDTQVTTGDHDAVTYFQDLIKILYTFVVFDFGNDVDTVIAMLFKNVADLLDVFGLSYERRGDKVEFIFHGKKYVFFVFGCQSR